MRLDEIGMAYKPSKIQHNYLPNMERHINQFRESAKCILEIGVQTDRSVKMWRDFFPNATIIGLDIDENCQKYSEERIDIIIGSQCDIDTLEELPDDIDVIIDDGGHIENDVIFSLNYLFEKKLKIGGVYMIEDMLVSPNQSPKLFQCLMQYLSGINHWPSDYTGPWSQLNHFSPEDDYISRFTTSLHFYRYLTVIEKNKNPEDDEGLKRIQYPTLCKENENYLHDRDLNDWSHLSDKSLISKFGANIKYGD